VGRLPALIRAAAPLALLSLLSLAAGCDGEGKEPAAAPAAQGRSNAVTAPTGARAPQTTTASAAAPKQAPAAPRKLCEGQSPRAVPTGAISTAAAPGAPALPATIGFGVGKWVWMNFWAAWCKPCKEEMPRLLGWQQKLRASGVMIDLVFVSLDDDQRQLTRFLEEQPGHGVRASYWLPEAQRPSWMTALGLKETPDLPVHAIVAPSGQVTCTIQGAVEDSDYPGVAAMLGAR
jgi:thiol-disulfide isomerase/thioredoxin